MATASCLAQWNAVLARAARMHPDTVAVETDDDQLTYGRLHDAVLRLAGGFAARVVGPGDRIAACLGNGTEIVVAFYAAQCLGVIVNAMAGPRWASRTVNGL